MLTWQKLQTFLTDRDLWLFIATIWKSSRRVLKVSKHIPAFDALIGLIWVNAPTKTPSQSEPRCISRCYQCRLGKRNHSFYFSLQFSLAAECKRHRADVCLLSKDVMCEKSKLLYHRFLARLDPVSEACRYHGPGSNARWCKCSRTCRLRVRFHSCTLLPSLASSICLIPTVPQPPASLTDGHTDLN